MPAALILVFPLFFMARGAWRLWKGVPPPPLDPEAPAYMQRLWPAVMRWFDVVWGIVAVVLFLVWFYLIRS